MRNGLSHFPPMTPTAGVPIPFFIQFENPLKTVAFFGLGKKRLRDLFKTSLRVLSSNKALKKKCEFFFLRG